MPGPGEATVANAGPSHGAASTSGATSASHSSTSGAGSASPDEIVGHLRLPTFSAVDAGIWFKRAEIQFRLRRITKSQTMADHVLASIPDDLFPQVSQWLDEQGNNPIEYADVKAYLLEKFTPAPEDRVEKILDLANRPLGDQRPSDVLTEMRALCRLPPDANGDQKQIDILLALWLKVLPKPVRSAITDFSSMEESQLASKANKLYAAHNAAERANKVASVVTDSLPDEGESLSDDTIAANLPRYKQTGDKQSFHKSDFSPYRYKHKQKSDTKYKHSSSDYKATASSCRRPCFYHARFGLDAKRCEPPCCWPKNP